MACIDCGVGDHFNCGNPCCCSQNSPVAEEIEYDEGETRASYRTYKRDSTLKDQQSTGRKRAARLYPLNEEKPCEWQGLRFAGGGRFPIIGCRDGKQQARHHGPDKNTLNNDKGNVHRICVFCHNRWHTLNDSGYTPEDSKLKHDPVTIATVEELVADIAFWANRKLVKAKD